MIAPVCNYLRIFLKASLLLVLFISPAFAYLDPGTGSMIIQVAIAGFLSALFTIKLFWYRIKATFNRLLGRPVDESFLQETSLLDDLPDKSTPEENDSKK
jgi:hypothetical protein